MKRLVSGQPPQGNKAGMKPISLTSFGVLIFPYKPGILSLSGKVCVTPILDSIVSSPFHTYFSSFYLSAPLLLFFSTL